MAIIWFASIMFVSLMLVHCPEAEGHVVGPEMPEHVSGGRTHIVAVLAGVNSALAQFLEDKDMFLFSKKA